MGEMVDDNLFLGISNSLTGAKWLKTPSDYTPSETQRYAERLTELADVPPAIAYYLAGKGISAETLPQFISPTLRDLLPDPFCMQAVDIAANRLADAVVHQERIGIFGDYDVDGACAAAICSRILTLLGCETEIHIPDRFSEGYGPNITALEALSAKGCSLILTVDCGITAHEPLQAAHAAGMEVIVIDHHLSGPVLPEALCVVNPNRLDDESGLGYLCAAGVCFLVMVAVLRALRERNFTPPSGVLPDLREELDLVALATICDVVPLKALNRAFVKQGLKIMGGRRKAGLNALADIAGMNEAPSPYALGFQLGPRINAGGRLGHSDLGVKLLSFPDAGEAAFIAEELHLLNAKRRDIEASILASAELQAELQLASAPDLPALVISGEGWHEGVIGIVAGRLKDKFNRPSIVIAIDPTTKLGKGSARGVAGIRLGDIIVGAAQRGLVTAGGGHDLAAGLSLTAEQVPSFTEYLQDVVSKNLTDNIQKHYYAAGSLSVAGCSMSLLDWLDKISPFGAAAAEPRFVLTYCQIKNARWMGTEKQHFSCIIDDGTAKPLRAVAFGVTGTPLQDALQKANDGSSVMVLGKLRKDSWRGGENIQFHIEDIATSSTS